MLSLFKKNPVEAIYVDDLDRLIGQIELIDIREPYEYKDGSIKTAKNIPMEQILQTPNHYLSKDKKYYIMCQSGMRSSRTSLTLSKQGFNVMNVGGGMGAYKGIYRV